MRSVYIGCLILFFISCKTETKPAILPHSKMEAVLFDFVMAEAYTNNRIPIDSVILARKDNVVLQKKIFASHKITKEQFVESLDYYTKNSGEFLKILDSISARENRKNTEPIISTKNE